MPAGIFQRAGNVADALLKQVIIPRIVDLLPTSALLLELIKNRETTNAEGLFVRSLARVGRNPSPQFRPDMGPIPPAGRQGYAEIRENTRQWWGSLAVSDSVLESTKSDDEAFINALDGEVSGLIDDARNYINRMAYLPGDGVLALVAGIHAVGATTIDLRGPGSRYFVDNIGADIGFYPVGVARQNLVPGDLLAAVGRQRVATVVDTDTITIEAPGLGAALADGDRVCLAGSDLSATVTNASTVCNSVLGLLALVDDGTFRDVLHNVSHTLQARWNSEIIRGAGGDPAAIELDEGAGAADASEPFDFLQRLVDGVHNRSGAYPEVLITDHAGKRRFQALLAADVRFEPLSLRGGYEVLTYSGGGKPLPFIVDKDCVHGMSSDGSDGAAVLGRLLRTFYFALNLDGFALLERTPMHFRDYDGSILVRDPNRSPFFEAQAGWAFNFLCLEPHKQGMLADIAVRSLPD